MFKALLLLPALLFCKRTDAQCTVNAGPDIDVCQSGSVQLNGIPEGNLSKFEWIGGKGTFDPSRISLNPEYTPSEDESGTQVKITLIGGGKCGDVTDDILLTVNTPVEAHAGLNRSICWGQMVDLHGTVKGKAAKTTWTTDGSGTFGDATMLDAVYSPSAADLEKKSVTLTLTAESIGVCGSDQSSTIISFDKGIVFTTQGEIFTDDSKPVALFIRSKQDPSKVDWTGNFTGTITKKSLIESFYTPSLEDMQRGSITVHVTVAHGDCNVSSDVVVHFKGK